MSAQDYKVTAISPEQKHWDSQYGPMVTYYVRLDSEGDTPIQLNKKADSPEPKEGDELYGDVTETQYGPKFKSAKKPFNPTHQKSPETEENIARAVSLKAAVEYHSVGAQTLVKTAEVLETAETFLTWLKGQKPPEEPEKSSDEQKRDWKNVGKDKVHEVVEGEPIQFDESEIPFKD